MLSRNDPQPSVLFSIQRKYLLVGVENLSEDVSVFGKIQRVVPSGTRIDLVDLANIMPRNLRRGPNASEFRDAFVKIFEQWPDEFGGPISPEKLVVSGPLYVLNPIAIVE
jgi:hypothetical protein